MVWIDVSELKKNTLTILVWCSIEDSNSEKKKKKKKKKKKHYLYPIIDVILITYFWFMLFSIHVIC